MMVWLINYSTDLTILLIQYTASRPSSPLRAHSSIEVYMHASVHSSILGVQEKCLWSVRGVEGGLDNI